MPDATPSEESVTLPNDRGEIDALEDRVLAAAEAAGYPKASCFAVKLAIEEAIVNAFKHGHADLDDSVPVHVTYKVTPETVFVTVEDQGPGFKPKDVPDPTLAENLERPCGRGLMLMRAYMTDVRHSDDGKRVEMTYAFPPDDDDDD